MKKLSVIIGRFQTNQLHEGHLDLIRQVRAMGNPILVLIGVTAATGTDKNPLSFEIRRHLFYTDLSLFAKVIPLFDMLSDKDWSDQIDSIISQLGFKEAVIWGGRDNSIEGYYSGKHEIKTIEQVGNHSATSLRKEIAKEPVNCPNFRAGIIHHVENRYPIVYSTVDIILWRIEEGYQILVGKKGDKFSFIGGFVDTNDNSLLKAAQRELEEETGITKEILAYLDSMKIEDERYKGTKDSIMTHIFMGIHNELPDKSRIKDKEFAEFRFIGENELDHLHDFHKPIALKFFNLFKE